MHSEYAWVYYTAEKEAYNMTYTKYSHMRAVFYETEKKEKVNERNAFEFTAPFLYTRAPGLRRRMYEPALYHYCTASGGYNGQT